MKKLILSLMFLAGIAAAQPYALGVLYTNVDPVGACTIRSIMQWNYNNGKLWACFLGTWTEATGGGMGTVTSVATTSPIGGGTITGAGTITCTTCTTNAAALTADLPVIGAGSQAAAVGTRSGNTTQYVTTTGAQTSGDCVKIDASGNHVANGSACAGGSLSVDGWYLTDGMGNYYSGPHHAVMTLPDSMNYSWVNQGSASEAVNGNALVLTVPNTSGTNVRARTESMGANTTLTAQFAFTSAYKDNLIGGIGFRESGTSKLITMGIQNSPTFAYRLQIDAWNSATSFSSGLFNSTSLGGMHNWVSFRLVYTAGSPGTIAFQVSNDDLNWETTFSQNANAFFTTAPDEWFFFIFADNASGSSYVTLYSWKTQ